MATITKPVTNLQVGDIVRFFSCRFEIISTGESRSHIDGGCAYGKFSEFVGPSPVAVPIGRFIDGTPVRGYFGPDKDWSFQGNRLATACVEI